MLGAKILYRTNFPSKYPSKSSDFWLTLPRDKYRTPPVGETTPSNPTSADGRIFRGLRSPPFPSETTNHIECPASRGKSAERNTSAVPYSEPFLPFDTSKILASNAASRGAKSGYGFAGILRKKYENAAKKIPDRNNPHLAPLAKPADFPSPLGKISRTSRVAQSAKINAPAPIACAANLRNSGKAAASAYADRTAAKIQTDSGAQTPRGAPG